MICVYGKVCRCKTEHQTVEVKVWPRRARTRRLALWVDHQGSDVRGFCGSEKVSTYFPSSGTSMKENSAGSH